MNKTMRSNAIKKIHGTRQWADKTVNCCTGCSNGCEYCYARFMADRFKQKSYDDWTNPEVRMHDVIRKHRNYGSLVMIPSSHDITLENLGACEQVIGNLLTSGNDLLIVSKPNFECISTICNKFADYKDKIIFRFSIGATDNSVLSLWEPNAPSYDERKQSLKYAHDAGFTTSVSVEPMLDPANIDDLIADLMPHVSETIWIGKMNYMGRIRINSKELALAVETLVEAQSDENILNLFSRLNGHPQIMWKDSIMKVVKKYNQNNAAIAA